MDNYQKYLNSPNLTDLIKLLVNKVCNESIYKENQNLVLKKLENLDLWIVDCLRFEPHKSHAHYDKVMKWIEIIKPKKTILTHMNIEVDYDHINSLCPDNCRAAFDGQKLIV